MLTRRSTTPLDTVRDLFDALNRDSGRAYGPELATVFGAGEVGFPMDISEHDGHLVVRANLPGYRKDEISVHVQNGVLTIEARRSETKEAKSPENAPAGERFYRKERYEGSLVRRLELPSRFVDTEPVAELKDGVLVLRFPESPASKPRQVSIR